MPWLSLDQQNLSSMVENKVMYWIKVHIIRVVHYFNCPAGQNLEEYWFPEEAERH